MGDSLQGMAGSLPVAGHCQDTSVEVIPFQFEARWRGVWETGIDQQRQRTAWPQRHPRRLGTDERCEVAHYLWKVHELPKVPEKVVGLPANISCRVGNGLLAKNCREKCVNREVRKMIGNVGDQA